MLNLQKKYIIWGSSAIVVMVIFFLYGLDDYFYPSTDDAYTGSGFINVAPQVTGSIKDILIQNNHLVKAGQLMFTIDSNPFELNLEQAQFQFKVLQKTYAQTMMDLKAAEYNVPAQESVYKTNLDYYNRILSLQKDNYISEVNLNTAISKVKVSEAAYKQAHNEEGHHLDIKLFCARD